MKKFSLFLISLLVISNQSLAQLSYASQFSLYYTDNLYRSPQKTQDAISSLNVDLTYENANRPLSFGFYSEYDRYFEHPDQNFWLGSARFEYFPFLKQDQSWQFYSALNLLGRFNRSQYDLYDYQDYQLKFALQYEGQSALNQIAYHYQLKHFNHFSALSNVTHHLNWRYNTAFKTRTSVIANVGFASRTYQSQNNIIVVRDTVGNTGGRWWGHNHRPPRIITRQITVKGNPTTFNQFTLSVRLAQNVFSGLGLFIQYLKSFDLSSSGTFQNYGTYLADDELFDDPLSYLSNEWMSQITWIFAQNWQVKLNTRMNQKQYLKEQAYLTASEASPSGPARRDKKLDLTLNLSKVLQIKENLTLNMEAELYYIRNQSNSYWYEYQNLIGGLNLQIVY